MSNLLRNRAIVLRSELGASGCSPGLRMKLSLAEATARFGKPSPARWRSRGKIVFAIASLIACSDSLRADVVTAETSSFDRQWTNASTWTSAPYYPNNDNPLGTTYRAVLKPEAYIWLYGTTITVDSLALTDAILNVNYATLSTGSLGFSGQSGLRLSASTLRNTSIPAGATVQAGYGSNVIQNPIAGATLDNVTLRGYLSIFPGWSANLINGTTLDNGVISMWAGSYEIDPTTYLEGVLQGIGTVNISGGVLPNSPPWPRESAVMGATIGADIVVTGQGYYRITSQTSSGTIQAVNAAHVHCVSITNNGTFSARDGTIQVDVLQNVVGDSMGGIALRGGAYEVYTNGVLDILNTSSTVTTNDAFVHLDGVSSQFGISWAMSTNNGTFAITGGRDFNLDNPLTSAGTLWAGVGSDLTIGGNFRQVPGGMTKVELGGTGAEGFGQFDIAGGAALDGTLDVELASGFVPQVGDVFDIIQAASVSGIFADLNLPPLPAGRWALEYGGDSVSLRVVPEPLFLPWIELLAVAIRARRMN